MLSCVFQVQVPEGTLTVSPGEAADTAALTSAYEQLAALTVAPQELFPKPKIPRNKISENIVSNLSS